MPRDVSSQMWHSLQWQKLVLEEIFFSKAIINSLSLTCFSFVSFYSELTSIYISTPYTMNIESIYDMKITDDIFKSIFNESFWISITISLKFVPKGPVDYKSALVQVMAWHRTGEKSLPESMLTKFDHHEQGLVEWTERKLARSFSSPISSKWPACSSKSGPTGVKQCTFHWLISSKLVQE